VNTVNERYSFDENTDEECSCSFDEQISLSFDEQASNSFGKHIVNE
jgi:hypothetical protein